MGDIVVTLEEEDKKIIYYKCDVCGSIFPESYINLLDYHEMSAETVCDHCLSIYRT